MSDDKDLQRIKFSGRMSFVSPSVGNVTVTEGGAEKPRNPAKEAEDEKAAAWRAGHAKGKAEAEAVMKTRMDALNAELNKVASGIPAALAEYFAELERQTRAEATELAFKIAEIILKRAINHRPNIKELIEEVLTPVTNPKGARLHLNPKVAELAASGSAGAIPTGVDILPDSGLAEGEAVLDTSQGIIDGTLEGRMSILREKFDKYVDGLVSEGGIPPVDGAGAK